MPYLVTLLTATRDEVALSQLNNHIHTYSTWYVHTPLPPYTSLTPIPSYCLSSHIPPMSLPLSSRVPPPFVLCPSPFCPVPLLRPPMSLPLLCRYPKEAIQPPCQSTMWTTPSRGTTSSSSAASATTSRPYWPTARDTDRELGSAGGEGGGGGIWHHTWGVREFCTYCTSQDYSTGTV